MSQKLADSGNSAKRNGNLDQFLADNGNGDPPSPPPYNALLNVFFSREGAENFDPENGGGLTKC